MKKQISSLTGLKRKAVTFCLVLASFLISLKGYSQDPGDNPDGPPPAVPLDDYLLPILIAVGVIIAFFVYRRTKKNTHTSH